MFRFDNVLTAAKHNQIIPIKLNKCSPNEQQVSENPFHIDVLKYHEVLTLYCQIISKLFV